MRGTTNRTRQQIQDEMVKLNARINVSGGVSGANVSVQTTAENLIPALRLAAEMLREPVVPGGGIRAGEEASASPGSRTARTEPGALAPLALARASIRFRERMSRYVGTIDEDIEDIGKVTLDDVKKFHAQFYGASHGELVIVGAVRSGRGEQSRGEVIRSLDQPRALYADHHELPKDRAGESEDRDAGQAECHVRCGPQAAHAGHGSGLSGDGAGELYVRGVDYFARAGSHPESRRSELRGEYRIFRIARRECGAIRVGAISNPKNTPKVEASFRDELAKILADGFTADELASAKNALLDLRKVARSRTMPYWD